MGQRTTIILQHRNKFAEKWNEQSVTTRVFNCQWGIGRIMPSQLMGILTGTFCASGQHQTFAASLLPPECRDSTEWYAEQKGVLDSIDFDRPELAGEIIDDCNNNGGIFLRIVTDEYGKNESIEYAYMLGYEEDGDYKQWCSADEWMAKNCRYIDEPFRKLYDQTLAYFGAVERCGGEAAPKTAKTSKTSKRKGSKAA